MFYLRSSQWAGRDKRCELRLHAPRVSEIHASLTWDGKCWALRDRNSTNGTFVNGARLGLAVVDLSAGDVISFGSEAETWTLDEDGPPGLILEEVGGEDVRHVPPNVGSALLPSPENAAVAVLFMRSAEWRVETAQDAWSLTDGDEISIGARRYRASVPAIRERTDGEPLSTDDSLLQAELEIGVTHHEEEADLTLKINGVSHRIVDRAPLYLLALLARARAKVTASPAGASIGDTGGWVAVEEILRQLDISPELLNVHVFRVRESLRELGIHDANQIIERRRGRMRIGLDASRVRIVRID